MTIHSDELGLALRWFYGLSADRRNAITKAMRSVEKLRIDGNQVLIAAYRLYNRTIQNSVPE